MLSPAELKKKTIFSFLGEVDLLWVSQHALASIDDATRLPGGRPIRVIGGPLSNFREHRRQLDVLRVLWKVRSFRVLAAKPGISG